MSKGVKRLLSVLLVTAMVFTGNISTTFGATTQVEEAIEADETVKAEVADQVDDSVATTMSESLEDADDVIQTVETADTEGESTGTIQLYEIQKNGNTTNEVACTKSIAVSVNGNNITSYTKGSEFTLGLEYAGGNIGSDVLIKFEDSEGKEQSEYTSKGFGTTCTVPAKATNGDTLKVVIDVRDNSTFTFNDDEDSHYYISKYKLFSDNGSGTDNSEKPLSITANERTSGGIQFEITPDEGYVVKSVSVPEDTGLAVCGPFSDQSGNGWGEFYQIPFSENVPILKDNITITVEVTNATWEVTDNRLYIYENCTMETYSSDKKAPWANEIFEDAVVYSSSITANAFLDCTSLKKVFVTANVKSVVPATAFTGCTNLEAVINESSVTVNLPDVSANNREWIKRAVEYSNYMLGKTDYAFARCTSIPAVDNNVKFEAICVEKSNIPQEIVWLSDSFKYNGYVYFGYVLPENCYQATVQLVNTTTGKSKDVCKLKYVQPIESAGIRAIHVDYFDADGDYEVVIKAEIEGKLYTGKSAEKINITAAPLLADVNPNSIKGKKEGGKYILTWEYDQGNLSNDDFDTVGFFICTHVDHGKNGSIGDLWGIGEKSDYNTDGYTRELKEGKTYSYSYDCSNLNVISDIENAYIAVEPYWSSGDGKYRSSRKVQNASDDTAYVQPWSDAAADNTKGVIRFYLDGVQIYTPSTVYEQVGEEASEMPVYRQCERIAASQAVLYTKGQIAAVGVMTPISIPSGSALDNVKCRTHGDSNLSEALKGGVITDDKGGRICAYVLPKDYCNGDIDIVYTSRPAKNIEISFNDGADSHYKITKYYAKEGPNSSLLFEKTNNQSNLKINDDEGFYGIFFTITPDSGYEVRDVYIANKGVADIDMSIGRDYSESGEPGDYYVDMSSLDGRDKVEIKVEFEGEETSPKKIVSTEGAVPSYYKVSGDADWEVFPYEQGNKKIEVPVGSTVMLAYKYSEQPTMAQYAVVDFKEASNTKSVRFPNSEPIEINGDKYTVFEYSVNSNKNDAVSFSAGTLPMMPALSNIKNEFTFYDEDEGNSFEVFNYSISGATAWRGKYYADNSANPVITIVLTTEYGTYIPSLSLIDYHGNNTTPEYLETPDSEYYNGYRAFKYCFDTKKNTKYSIDLLRNSDGLEITDAPKYTVTFCGNEGLLSDTDEEYNDHYSVSHYIGEEIGFDNPFERKGYTFDSWNTKKDGTGTKYDTKNKALNKDIDLYAQWKPITYTLRYHSNYPSGRDVVKTQTVTYDVTFKLDTLKKLGFAETGASFIGWSTEKTGVSLGETVQGYSDGQELKNLGSEQGAVVDLYAQWKTVDYLIFFDSGLVADDDVSKTKDGTLKKGGYQLLGLDDSFNPNNSDTVASIDISNFRSSLSNGYLQAMKYNESIVLTGKEYYRRGYTLTGWRNSKTGKVIKNGTISNLTTSPEAIVLTAQWTKNKYSIKYNLNGGSFKKGYKAVTSYVVEDTVRVTESGPIYGGIDITDGNHVSRKGYWFLEWYDNKQLEGESVTTIGTQEELKSYELYAKWTPILYIVNFVGNATDAVTEDPSEEGSEQGDLVEARINYDETYNLPVYTRPGYKFVGWTLTENGSGRKLTAKTIKNLIDVNGDEITYYAQWAPETYKITYKLEGGSLPRGAVTSYKKQDSPIELKIPVKPGYTFLGWRPEVQAPGGSVELNPTEESEVIPGTEELHEVTAETIKENSYGNIILTANWHENKYQVAFKSGIEVTEETSPSEIAEKEYKYTDVLDLYSVAQEIEKANPSITDKSISAFYSTNSKGKKTTYTLGKSYSKLLAENMATIELTAVWSPKTYYIDYDLAEDVTVKNAPVKYSVNTKKDTGIPAAVKTGYIFNGWTIKYSDSEEKVSENLLKAIPKNTTGDLKLTPVFTPITFKVVLDKNAKDAVLLEGKTAEYPGLKYDDDANNVVENVFSRKGYTFGGYNTKPNGSKGVYLADATGEGNDGKYALDNPTTKNGATVKLYAIWIPNQYDITYAGLVDGDVNNNADSFTYDKQLNLSNPARAGWTFVKWVAEQVDGDTGALSVATNRAGSVTAIKKDNTAKVKLTAEFTENSYKVMINSNGGVGFAAGSDVTKAKGVNYNLGTFGYSENFADKLNDYMSDPNSGVEGITNNIPATYFGKKGFIFKGLATDNKGKNMVCSREETGSLSELKGLSVKNNSTVTLYAIWEKIAVATPVITATSDEPGKITVNYSSKTAMTDPRFQIQYSTSINFRNPELNLFGAPGTSYTNDVALDAGTYFVRVRQNSIDYLENATYSAWSEVKVVNVVNVN